MDALTARGTEGSLLARGSLPSYTSYSVFVQEIAVRPSYRPQLVSLESRLQPGSLLLKDLGTTALFDSFGALDLQNGAPDPHQPPALVSTTDQTQGNPTAPATPALTPTFPALNADTQMQSALEPPLLAVANLDTRLLDAALVNQAQPQALKGDDTIHTNGSMCEEPGNIVVNGDFEDPTSTVWVQVGDPFAGYVEGGGALSPAYHFMMGATDAHGLIYQDLTTTPGQMYTVRVSMHAGDSDPANFLALKWNDQVIDVLTTQATPDYQRFTYTAAVAGSAGGTDRFTFEEQNNPDYWHVDDVCVTPAV